LVLFVLCPAADLFDEAVGDFLVSGLRFFGYDIVDSNGEVFEAFGIFGFFNSFVFGRILRGREVPLLFLLEGGVVIFEFFFFIEEVGIFGEL
jgi:hypothetical protein